MKAHLQQVIVTSEGTEMLGCIAGVGEGADLLSHEATFTADMREKAHIAQHSTAPMAGAFARALGAQTLVLTHFSGRFLDWKGRVSKLCIN